MIFHHKKCNPMKVIGQARNTYHATLLYNKNTNIVTQDYSAGTRVNTKESNQALQSWNPSPKNGILILLKLKLDNLFVCRDHSGRLHYKNGNKLVTVQFFWQRH